ncbi:uncharacterized protein RAG0_14420 [Rhynchosporium agropyri]|uniref:Fibronectin type-III domain-containing protein n=1 Tax=Rhynchosporium agropyri TaxID=914238 RepID=A0A1E1LGZ8_9HELO|nr:uncharacterized protein RAG0_14420 [Rhynchosporium agropyri]
MPLRLVLRNVHNLAILRKMPHKPVKPEDAGRNASAELREKSLTKAEPVLDEETLTQDPDLSQNLEDTSVLHRIAICDPPLLLFIYRTEVAEIVTTVVTTISRTATASLYHQYCMNATTFYCGLIDWVLGHGHLIMLIIQSTATFSAAAWLLFRAYKTLRTPVNILIKVLGVEVPDAPEVTLAGIKSTAITLQWSSPVPSPKGSVVKYLIQVNGVNVGESSRSETAIEVTGLKPGHFYNVRVIAVAPNHFQTGSRVLRLSTLRKDGRPYQGHSGPASEKDGEDDDDDDDYSDSNDDTQLGRGHGVEIQAATLPEPAQSPMVREHSGGFPGGGSQAGQRRNTGGRKHSPSTAAADQAARERAISKLPEETMHQLTEKFEHTRRETEIAAVMIARELEDFKEQYLQLSKERDVHKQTLKDKEEQSEKVKKDANTAERLNRVAQNKKSQREKVLKDKKAEREKMRDDMARWKDEIETMRDEKEKWRMEKAKLGTAKDDEVSDIQRQIAQQQLVFEGLEKEIQARGRQIRDLEVERMKLPGSADDEESQAQDALDKKEEAEWQAVERSLVSRLNSSSQRLRDIEIMISQQRSQLSALEVAHHAAAQQPMMFHGDSSGVDFDSTGGQGKTKPRRTRNRRSRTSTISSPTSAYPTLDSPFSSTYNNCNNPSPAFAPAPYMQLSNDTGMVIQADHISGMSDDEIRHFTAGAPLSPTATSLLPSKLFLDDEHDDQDRQDEHDGRAPPLGHVMYGSIGESYDKDPQSPASSSRSASLISSPHDSSHNLALYGVSSHDYPKDSERRSVKSPLSGFGTIGSPATEPTAQKGGIMNLFGIPRMRGKTIQEDGPALGSLKHGQSQSFPRSSEEPEAPNIKHRRISLSSPNWGSIFKGSSAANTSTQGNAPAPARPLGARSRRGFPFSSNSVDEPNHSERDLSSPRPISISSSDFPRPSTDSAPFGWGPAPEINRNSPLAANWSVHTSAPQPWSRNPSRRPSIQHGSSSALTADSAPDDYDDFTGQASPPPVGVIGTRPASSHKPPTPRLNPAAPAFEKYGLPLPSKNDRGKGRAFEALTSPDDLSPHDITNVSSPAASRKSRDAHSIRTQNSMAESHESLDRAVSNTTSEFPSGSSAKEKDGSSFRQLLRKGSSSKFSIASFRNKENGLFSGKKAVSSNANSDKENSFDEFGEEGGYGRSGDSITSSPMIGSIGSGEWKGKDKEAGTPKEGRMSVGWGLFTLKKGRGRESSEVDRSEAEVTGDET